MKVKIHMRDIQRKLKPNFKKANHNLYNFRKTKFYILCLNIVRFVLFKILNSNEKI